ncbi:MAG: homoserine O-acetyltransferase [Deinococcales bacterium]
MNLPEHHFEIEKFGELEVRVLFPEPKPAKRDVRHTTLFIKKPLELELGGLLSTVRVAYSTYGQLNAQKDNTLVVCHALTGSSSVASWWTEALGAGKMLDTDRYFIVCVNVLGGCYGSTGPTSINPQTNRTYGAQFPEITIGDMVRVQAALLEHLGIHKIRAVIGGSMGGMQALAWLQLYGDRIGAGVVIGAPPRHSAWGITFSHLARMAIQGDPNFKEGKYAAQPNGLALARAITTLFFRSPESFALTQGRRSSPSDPARFAMETYLEHQGERLLERFDANSYITISKAMDRFDLSRTALAQIAVPTLCIGISSDILYLPAEVREIAENVQRGSYWELESPHGHDAFLLETARLTEQVHSFLAQVER